MTRFFPHSHLEGAKADAFGLGGAEMGVNWRRGATRVAVAVVSVGFAPTGPAEAAPPQIRAVVYNDAGSAAEVVSRAEREVTRTFSEIGVETIRLDVDQFTREIPTDPAARQPEQESSKRSSTDHGHYLREGNPGWKAKFYTNGTSFYDAHYHGSRTHLALDKDTPRLAASRPPAAWWRDQKSAGSAIDTSGKPPDWR